MSAPTPEPTTPAPRGARAFLLVWAAVTAVAALSHFAFAPRMGLYEDDHWLIGVPMCEWTSTADLRTELWWKFAEFYQGRPMHYGFGFPLAYLGTHLGGLLGAFALAAAVWALNAGLCLALLWKRFGPTAATAAALTFVLLPADTTHALVHTAFFVHPSVTCLLLSGLAYARGYRLLAVLLSAGSLVTYETCFLPALAWPVLFRDPDGRFWRRALVHGVLMGAVLAVAVFARMKTGESRVTETLGDKSAVVKKVAELAVVGPKSSFMTFIDRPKWVLKTWRQSAPFSNPGPGRTTTGGVALAAGAFALLALVAARRAAPAVAPDAPAPDAPPVVRLLVAGLLMVVLSYVIALTRLPHVVDGRMSSVHIGATAGWAVFFGGAAAGLVAALARLGAPRAAAPVLAAYFCLLSAFHVYVQREYVRAWVAQGEFWRDVAAECPDVKPGTVILYPLVQPTSLMVRHQEWADYRVFRFLFAVPPDWHTPPEAYPLGHMSWGVPRNYEGYNWNEVEREGDKLFLRHWGARYVHLEPGNVILLRQLPGGKYERMTGTVTMHGIDLPLKPREGPSFEFRPHLLYRAMFPNGLEPETRRRVSVGPPKEAAP